MITLQEHERELVILALSKVIESNPSYRVDEYKKLLERLRSYEPESESLPINSIHEYDEY
jgi:hypothetical protein